jgi:enediyne biosynthesis protein E4
VSSGASFLKVKLIGTRSNRSAIGGRVTVKYGGRIQALEVMSQASFYSCNDPRLHFGLGSAKSAEIEVRWPNGVVEHVGNVMANCLVVIKEGSGIVSKAEAGKIGT